MPTARRFLRDHQPGERIEGPLSIANAQLGRTKQDKPFLKAIVGDKSGSCPARMWSIDEAAFRRLPTEGFVHIEGEVQAYQGEMQIIIHSIERLHASTDLLRELLPATERHPDDLFNDLVRELADLQHPAMIALAEQYLTDEPLMERLRAAPAAKSMHHARIGGLVEHTLSVVRLARLICPHYPRINRDLVTLGLFLHDLGKTLELSYDGPFGYTDRGELIGHVVDGVIMLHDKAQQLMLTKGIRLPPNALLVLQHIIVSHHGEPEFGAAKRPSTPEAILVHAIDNMDAKLTAALDAARPDHPTPDLGGNFTEKLWALDTKLYRPDPLADEPR